MQKLLPFCGALLVFAFAISGCSSGNNSTSPMQASAVVVHISDPTTCQAPNGSFSAVWVAISDVKIHQSSTAAPNDPGWVDLTPNLSNSNTPMQVNLLGNPNNECFLAQLNDRTQIQAGTYQQIRIFLADNSQASKIANNKCPAGVSNCVVLANNTTIPLTLPSENQTGIKIPSGQIVGGQFTVAAGQTEDLDIDFNTCASIVLAGNQALLKPVLHAGEVSPQTQTINGTVVSGNSPVVGAMVMLAKPNASLACSGAGCVSNAAVEDVIMASTTDGSGNFVFCPLVGNGPFDVIAIATSGGTAFAATVVSGVQPGTTLTGANKVPLVSAGAQATINGTVTTTSTTNTAIAEKDITVVPLQPFTVSINGTPTNLLLPIPMIGANSTVTTIDTIVPNPNTCTSNTVGCGDYKLFVPAGNPNVGVFNASGTTFTQASGSVNYIVDAQTSQCTPSEEQTNTQATSPPTPLTVTAGGTVTASTLAFTVCQ